MFCKAPFMSLAVLSDGCSVCCQLPFIDKTYDFNSYNFKRLREEMHLGKEKKDLDLYRCANCPIAHSFEDFISLNDSYFANLINLDESNNIEDWKITCIHLTLGNICNSACKTCNKYNSNMYSTLYENDPGINKILDYRKIIIENKDSLSLVAIIGGETFMYKDDLEFLYEALNPNTNVTIYTNGTIYDEELLKRFAKKFILNIQVSIDGYGLKNDYIRSGTHFNDIKENVKSIHQISQRTCIVFTVSLLNCFELYDEIKKLIDEFNICIIINVVIYPEHYSVRCLSKELKDRVFAEIKKIETAFPEGVTNMIALYSALESSAEKSFEENVSTLLKDLEVKDKAFDFDTNANLSPALKLILNKKEA